MAEDFKAIETQEEFNERIKDRLERERSTISKQFEEQIRKAEADRDTYKGQIEGFQTSAKENAEKISTLETQLAEVSSKAAGLEVENLRTQVAIDKGLPLELRDRLNGKTKEELEKDADSLGELFKKQNNKNIPQFEQHEDNPADQKKAALLELAKGLKKGD